MRSVVRLRHVVALVFALGVLCPPLSHAQVPGRFYWKSLSGGSAVPVIVNDISGNTNPFDPAHIVTPGGEVDGTLAIVGYAQTFELFERSTMAAILLPMGRVSGELTVGGRSFNQSANGFGDPMLEFNINVIGPRAQKNIPMPCAMSPGSRSTFWRTSRCRSASTTAASR